jgi:hypothetical protein
MAEKKPIINGANGGKVASVAPEKPLTEAERAQEPRAGIAANSWTSMIFSPARTLQEGAGRPDVPYNFIPWKRRGRKLAIVPTPAS